MKYFEMNVVLDIQIRGDDGSEATKSHRINALGKSKHDLQREIEAIIEKEVPLT